MALEGNLVLCQSGGPTAVINASAAGAIRQALMHECITGIYGAQNGILGVLEDNLFDIKAEDPDDIDLLKHTPGASTGSCRYKLKGDADFQRVFDVFKKHNVRYFVIAGGNDSMDTADRINRLASAYNYDLRVTGIAKTIDNDLFGTDHCPGYGSAAKLAGTIVRELYVDLLSLKGTSTGVFILETMGRNVGWLAAAAALATIDSHLVYVPEIPTSLDKICDDVKKIHDRDGVCFVTASEGLCGEEVGDDGKPIRIAEDRTTLDSFGHGALGGLGVKLADTIKERLGIKCRAMVAGNVWRSARHWASGVDVEEAYIIGKTAVRQAVTGESDGKMITAVRESNNPYRFKTGLIDLEAVANGEKLLPREWMNAEGNHPTEAFLEYARPLIKGHAPLIYDEHGLPRFAQLKRKLIPKVMETPYVRHD